MSPLTEAITIVLCIIGAFTALLGLITGGKKEE
jgi:hypothetical protein